MPSPGNGARPFFWIQETVTDFQNLRKSTPTPLISTPELVACPIFDFTFSAGKNKSVPDVLESREALRLK
jgi:hypothetical protein